MTRLFVLFSAIALLFSAQRNTRSNTDKNAYHKEG